MARRRTSGGRGLDGLSREDWLHVGRSAAAIGVVGGTLALGALLAERPDAPRAGGADPGRAVVVAAPAEASTHQAPTEWTELEQEAADPAPVPRAPADPSGAGETLRDRMDADTRRLTGKDDEWTLQLMAACDPSNVERAVTALGSDRRLLVLPVTIDGRSCFRVCWGPYASRAAAEADRARLPATARSLSATPQPRPVSEVL